MELMISVLSAREAHDALAGGAAILDVKNPAEGSLGAQPPRVIRDIIKIGAGRVSVSAAIGDMPNLPATAALAALGAASCGADFIKVGLRGPANESEALVMLREIREAVKDYPVSVVAAGYADHARSGALDPACLPRVAAAAGIRGCLLDTAVKDGHNLFEYLGPRQIQAMAEQAHAAGLLFALAGALREKDLPQARKLGADIVGLRTAVCRDNRREGPLEAGRVRRLLQNPALIPGGGSPGI
ncbi:MAG: (5-formylfuran-3-yl)methyl phosphate synthase [Acidobacteria bacterium]|nr:(5-formylfuran-3-yl)methyl phosphate synthase [Acidobacteriota bacterium]